MHPYITNVNCLMFCVFDTSVTRRRLDSNVYMGEMILIICETNYTQKMYTNKLKIVSKIDNSNNQNSEIFYYLNRLIFLNFAKCYNENITCKIQNKLI